MNNEALNVLKNRRTIRNYKSEQISDEALKAILEAGTYAPTGHGTQSPTIIAVQNKATIELLNRLNANILGKPEGNPYYGAPTIILVFASSKAHTPIEDAILVASNILNASYAVGLGSCYINRSKQMFETKEGQELKKKWNIPEDDYCVASIGVGYIDGKTPSPKPRKENYYRIIK